MKKKRIQSSNLSQIKFNEQIRTKNGQFFDLIAYKIEL